MDLCSIEWCKNLSYWWDTIFPIPSYDVQCSLCVSKITKGDYYCTCMNNHRFHIGCFLKYCYENNILLPNEKKIPIHMCPLCTEYILKQD